MENNTTVYKNKIALTSVGRVKKYCNIGLLVAVLTACFAYLKINFFELVVALPEFVTFFVKNFLPPNFANVGEYLPYIVETLLFAVVGTYFSAVLAFFMGLMMSDINTIAWLRGIFRVISSVLRNIPILIWTSILVYIFGIGSVVGLLALILATLGFLTRSYAESINEIAGQKLESLVASGAGKLQIIWHGLIPAFIPAWINWTLFSFELNIRASAILGMVGAGGIGIMIQTNLRLFKYKEAFSLILILILLVLITEFITNKLREKIR